MLTILFAAASGCWLCQHVGFYRTEAGTQNLEISTQGIAHDISWLWSVVAAACTFVIATGRGTRAYWNHVLCPWAVSYGLTLPNVPALVLPTTSQGVISQSEKRQTA